MDSMIEREYEGNGGRRIRHIVRCKYCGYRAILQEVVVRHTPQGLIRVSKVT